jgi:hypothetical protein
MLQGALGFLAVLAIIALAVIAVMAAVLYGSRALGWGLHHHPRTAMAVALFLALGAVLSYPLFFPGCTLSIGLGRLAHCPASQP